MPSTSIRYAPGFSSLTKITDTLYVQAFVGQGVHPSYGPVLQQQVGAIWNWAGKPMLGSQLVANQYMFTIAEIRYLVYQDGVVVQVGFHYVSTAASPQNKSLGMSNTSGSALPDLGEAGDPSQPVATE
jgi:hypothetical protein